MIAYSGSRASILADNDLTHESSMLGVPLDYDWARKPKKARWNAVPEGYSALTGWGQVFFDAAAPASNATIQIRNMECYGHTPSGWVLLQSGPTQGAQFAPDYSGNVASAPLESSIVNGVASIRISFGVAYHWWLASRGSIPAGFDALLVTFDARSVDSDYLLIGGGADYWLNESAPYPANKGIGVGRIKRLARYWDTYGFTTATASQLQDF